MNKKRILSTLLGIGILLAIVPTVLGNYGLFPNFSGDSHGGCHVGTNPESSNGWIYVTSNASTVDPSEEFMLSVQVVTFTEAANANISIGFPDNRGNNNYFTFSIKYFNNITLDGSGNSTVLYFTVIAPSEDGDYTLVVDALKGHINGTAKNFNWTAGSVGVTVSSIIGGGPTTLLGQFIEFITNPYVFYSLITILLGILMGLGIKLKRRLDRSRILKADTLKDREKLGIKLKEYAENDIIKECANCTMCRDECPTFYSREAESYYAGGRLRVLRAYVEQGYPIDDDFVEAMYYCTTCKQCEDRCPVPVKYVDIIEELRANLVKHKVGPYGKQLGMAKAVHANKNPYNEPADCRGNWCTEDEDIAKDIKTLERGPVGYFVGCTASFRTKNAAQNTAKILSKITDGIVILGSGEYCCGSPLIRTGQEDFDLPLNDKETVKFKVKDLITHNVESLIMKDVKEVVFSCSGCYKTSLDDWPRYYEKEIPFKSTHITQFLARKVAEGEIRFKPLNKKITYHDPCHLGRHRGVYDEPREVLKAIPGVELVEMPFNRNRSRCCGAGAGVKAGYPQDALKIAKIRVQEAFDTGADILATSCVFCKYNFLDAKKELGLEIDIVNVEDLVIDLLITNGSSIEKESKPEEIEKKSELVLTNFNLYCGECKKWVPQPAKKIVQGNEVCEHCNHVLYFVPKCHDCGNAIIKPIGDFNAFRRDPPLCEKCGGRFFIQ